LKKVQSWKVEKVEEAEAKAVRNLISASELPTEGLDDAELWCVKGERRRILGVAGLETWGTQGLLRSVAVEIGHRNAGVGTSLVRHVISEARKKKMREIYLLTGSAPMFFESLGFRAVDRSGIRGGVLNSVEFRELCPETAPVMWTNLLIKTRKPRVGSLKAP
jgi:amino-acid N-acetyltransferase